MTSGKADSLNKYGKFPSPLPKILIEMISETIFVLNRVKTAVELQRMTFTSHNCRPFGSHNANRTYWKERLAPKPRLTSC